MRGSPWVFGLWVLRSTVYIYPTGGLESKALISSLVIYLWFEVTTEPSLCKQ